MLCLENLKYKEQVEDFGYKGDCEEKWRRNYVFLAKNYGNLLIRL